MSFEHTVALVTGAGSGIGRAVALALASRGCAVAVVDRAMNDARETAAQIARSLVLRVDVSDEAQVRHAVERTEGELGPIRFACNAAGIQGEVAPLHQGTERGFDRTLAVNLAGAFYCMKHELAAMIPRRRGVVVNVASVLSHVGAERLGAYVASKHGLLGLTRTAALEAAASGVRVNAVCPSLVDTPMTQRSLRAEPTLRDKLQASFPHLRMGEAHEVAAAVLWLCGEQASFVTGAALCADGGYLAT